MDNVKKYQWSTMFEGEQIVIRTDDEVEFDRLKTKYREEVANIGKNAPKMPLPAVSQPSQPRPPSEFFGVCKKNASHGNMIMGRNGKPYCKQCYLEWKESQKVTPF